MTTVFPFTGFLAPVDNVPILNVLKAGSSVPVKFQLGGDRGLAILAAGSPAAQRVNCSSTAQLDPITVTATAGNSGLSYDAATQTYTYVWKTDKSWGACRQLVVKLNDGSYHRANFKLK